MTDKKLLKIYIEGFIDELCNNFDNRRLNNNLDGKAYNLGSFHAKVGDESKSFDSLSDEQILKIIRNRKYKDTEDILEFVKSKWKLSIQEETVLEGILRNFFAQNKEEIDKLDYLINDETELLLNLLSSYEIENYACEQFDLISKKWEGDLVDALHDLDYDFSEKISLEDHIEIVEDHGYQVLETKDSYKDIVSQAMAHQWMELFEEMTMQQRELYINQIRGVYER